MKKSHNPERLKRIINKISSGMSNPDIAESEGISIENLHRTCAYHGISLPKIKRESRSSRHIVRRQQKESSESTVLIGVLDKYMIAGGR